jgi:hypothetical protein
LEDNTEERKKKKSERTKKKDRTKYSRDGRNRQSNIQPIKGTKEGRESRTNE